MPLAREMQMALENQPRTRPAQARYFPTTAQPSARIAPPQTSAASMGQKFFRKYSEWPIAPNPSLTMSH